MSVLDDLAENPALAASLSPDERQRLLQQCAALIIALAVAPAPSKEPKRRSSPVNEVYLTVEEAATRIRRAPSTLYHWIASGKLKEETGLCRVQGQPLIEWPVFEQCFVHGIARKR